MIVANFVDINYHHSSKLLITVGILLEYLGNHYQLPIQTVQFQCFIGI